MTSLIKEPVFTEEMCAGVKRLGYGATQTIRLYGEEFEVVSDPFLADGGIAVQVRTRKNSAVRVVQLPATILQSVKGSASVAA